MQKIALVVLVTSLLFGCKTSQTGVSREGAESSAKDFEPVTEIKMTVEIEEESNYIIERYKEKVFLIVANSGIFPKHCAAKLNRGVAAVVDMKLTPQTYKIYHYTTHIMHGVTFYLQNEDGSRANFRIHCSIRKFKPALEFLNKTAGIKVHDLSDSN